MADEQKTDVKFAIDIATGGVCWFYSPNSPDLTEQQALVISATQMVGALRQVAEGLNAIAAAIRERD